MRQPDPARNLHCAMALAHAHQQRWQGLDKSEQALYLLHAGSIIAALNEYDARKRGKAVSAGLRRTHAAGERGRPRIAKSKEQACRQMLLSKVDFRSIRSETGLGMSTITRIKQELEKTGVLANASGAGGTAADSS